MGKALAAVAALKGLLSAVDSDVLLKYSNWIPFFKYFVADGGRTEPKRPRGNERTLRWCLNLNAFSQ